MWGKPRSQGSCEGQGLGTLVTSWEKGEGDRHAVFHFGGENNVSGRGCGQGNQSLKALVNFSILLEKSLRNMFKIACV